MSLAAKHNKLWQDYQKKVRAINANAANRLAVAAEEYTEAMTKLDAPATVGKSKRSKTDVSRQRSQR